MRPTPARVCLAVVVAGLLAIGVALTRDPSPPAPERAAIPAIKIVERPDNGPEVVAGAPGSREQLAAFGGVVAALGAVGALAARNLEQAGRRYPAGGASDSR